MTNSKIITSLPSTDSDNILTKFILIRSSTPIAMDGERTTITQVWKGPSSLALNKDTFKDIFETGTFWPNFADNSRAKNCFDFNSAKFADCFPDKYYRLDGYSVEQLDGFHSTITFTWLDDGSGTTDDDDDEPGSSWTMQMVPDSISPVEAMAVQYQTLDPNTVQLYLAQMSQNPNPNMNTLGYLVNGEFQQGDAVNDLVKRAAKYAAQGIRAQRHYPIISHNYITNRKGLEKLNMKNVDKITKLPENCPIKLSGWNWLYGGINISYESASGRYTVQQQWIGSETPWNTDLYETA